MKKVKALASVLVLAMVCALFAACGDTTDPLVSITNSLEYDLAALHISASTDDDWGDSFLDDILPDGDSLDLTLGSGEESDYDIKAVDIDGDYYYFYGVPLSAGAALELVSTDDGWQAAVTPKKGDTVTVEGDFEFGEWEDTSGNAATETETPVSAPTKDDPLENSVAMPGYEDLVIYYPATMQVLLTNERFVQIDAVNDPDYKNVIIFDLIGIDDSYDKRLSSADTAQAALIELAGKVCDLTFPDLFISSVGQDFVDGESYYSLVYYVWMSGEVFLDAGSTPVRGVLECRYYGHTGYFLSVFTLADEAAIQRYFNISQKMLDLVNLGGGWSTPDASASGGAAWSDPGDYYYYDDYDPWSDPGDTGDYYDGYYDDYEYDPWSDPGDTGDYYDGYYDDYEYDPWSDPGDTGDYYYDDGTWYESNDYDF